MGYIMTNTVYGPKTGEVKLQLNNIYENAFICKCVFNKKKKKSSVQKSRWSVSVDDIRKLLLSLRLPITPPNCYFTLSRAIAFMLLCYQSVSKPICIIICSQRIKLTISTKRCKHVRYGHNFFMSRIAIYHGHITILVIDQVYCNVYSYEFICLYNIISAPLNLSTCCTYVKLNIGSGHIIILRNPLLYTQYGYT